jgi:hypothetical protein
MTITAVGDLTLGATLTATTSATAAVEVLAAAALPELTAKLSGYTNLLIPSPSFDIGAQATVAASAVVDATAEVAALPGGAGVALAAGLTVAVAAQQSAQRSIAGASPSLALKVDSALASLASLKVQVSAGVTGPNVNLTLIASVIAQLEAVKLAIETQVDLVASIGAQLGVSGLRLYRFDGDISTAGAELQAQVTADGLHGELHFVVILPTTPAAWSALQATVRTS